MQIYASRTLTVTFLLLIDRLLVRNFTAAVLAWLTASRAMIRVLLAPLVYTFILLICLEPPRRYWGKFYCHI